MMHSPSPTFNCVGPGAVGTGSIAGMRMLNFLKNKVHIWPFEEIVPFKKVLSLRFFQHFILD